MSTKETQAMKQRSVAELEKGLRDSRDKLRNLKLDLMAGKVKNVGDIRLVRKDIARMLTFLNAAKRQEKKATK
jgi:ribosomal protein L29